MPPQGRTLHAEACGARAAPVTLGVMIVVDSVVKEFGGPLARLRGERVRALDGLSLRADPGEAWGIVGPNGSGKTTLLRLLLGYVAPTSGEATVDALAPRRYAERHGIAYVPERAAMPPGRTVGETLRAFAALSEVETPGEATARVMAQFDLEGVRGRRVGALSKGSLQRVALAQAFLAPRRIMILDEATDGLDPAWTARLRALLAAWRAEDPARVLLFSSHDLEEVERVAERVLVLEAGRVRETVELGAPSAETVLLELPAADAERARALFPGAAVRPARTTLRARYEAGAGGAP
jgi:ABC-2 type transport system ATP-binding protein